MNQKYKRLPILADILYVKNGHQVFVGIPTTNHYISNGIPIPNGYPITPIYNNEITTANSLPNDEQGLIIPIQMQCKYSRKTGTTLMMHRSAPQTWIAAFIIFIFFLPAFFVTFLIRDCKNKVHYCPNCGQFVGKKQYKICKSV